LSCITACTCDIIMWTKNDRNNIRWCDLYDDFLKMVRLMDNFLFLKCSCLLFVSEVFNFEKQRAWFAILCFLSACCRLARADFFSVLLEICTNFVAKIFYKARDIFFTVDFCSETLEFKRKSVIWFHFWKSWRGRELHLCLWGEC
jgi:hypothetical protein